ncbi:MAG: ADP-ribosylglycohydrolase family protein [Fibrobacteria bacterium]|nr:ADP-ribosylglycohydrolase family protein [Fibrobacteria bacterium]
MSDLPSRAQGAVLGLAAGNALGLPFESIWPASKIRQVTQGVVREIPDDTRESPWDDETAHFALVAESILETGDIEPRDLAQRLIRWRDENGRGMPVLLEKVLEEVEGDVPVLEASEEVCERLGKNWSAGNGSLVRAVPVALAAKGDRIRLVRMARDAARTSHWNPLCVGSTIALGLALDDLLQGREFDPASLAAEISSLGLPETVSQAVSGARLPLSAFQLDGKQKGWAIKSLQVALWAARAEGTVEEILERVILEGGDTDTNAALAGATLGASRGREALPERWIESLHDSSRLSDLAQALSR